MSVYEPNVTAVRLTMEERNLHRMLQERTDELGLVRRELHEWKTRAEKAERERDEERTRADAALRVVVDTTKELVAAEFERDNARGTCKILGQSLDEARRHPSSVEAQEAMQALDDAGVPCALGDTLPSRVRWLTAQNRQLATAVAAATDGDAFVLTRTAWHLANGCDTVSRAAAEARRELAVVMGGGS